MRGRDEGCSGGVLQGHEGTRARGRGAAMSHNCESWLGAELQLREAYGDEAR